MTGYDIYLNNTLLTSVPASALTYTDNEPDTLTAAYFVRAHDAAGNQSGNSNTVTRTGQTGDQTAPTSPGNLAVTTPTSGTVKLTWTASTDNVGVTSYVVYRNGAIDTSVSGSTLTYSESQPDTATVTYYVVAKDAAGNQSQPSNTVTRTGTGGGGTNLAVGRPITGTANTYIYVPTNANDNDLTTYFEGSTYPTQATVSLLGNATLSSVVVKLNPDASWGPRTQTIAVLGQPQSGGSFVTLAAAQSYSFSPSTGNSVTIPVSGQYQNIELSITSNSGAPGGQVAEFQIFGTPAPNPDLTPTAISWTPTSPIETDAITVSTTVQNVGTASSAASSVNVYLGNTKVGTSTVPALAAGAQTVVTTNIGTQTAGSYAVTAKVDESNTFVELNDSNNNLTGATNLVVQPVQSADLVGSTSWNPGNPSAGQSVAFTVQLKNQGNISTSSGSHGVTVTIADSTGATVKTLTGSYTGVLAAGASQNVNVGSWTAVNGKYTVTTVVAVDSAELSVKQANNTSTTNLFVGQGANMPYDNYEAAWQMKAIGLPAPSNARTRSSTACERRSLSGANPPGMTRASKSPSATCSTVVSTGTGPWPFFPCTGVVVEPGHGHLDVLLGQPVQRIQQLHVFEVVRGQDENGALCESHVSDHTGADAGDLCTGRPPDPVPAMRAERMPVPPLCRYRAAMARTSLTYQQAWL